MRSWPKAFECDPVLRRWFISACEALVIYGTPRENWHPDLSVWDADFVWAEAKRLLNY